MGIGSWPRLPHIITGPRCSSNPLMNHLEHILSTTVETHEGASGPEVNAVIAGVTDTKKTRFLEAKGVRNIETNEPVSVDDVLCFFSCTKPMTAMATLILVDQGKLEFDVPAKKYLPVLGEFGIVGEDTVDSKGNLTTRPQKPQNDITIRHLLLHNSGFAYIFTDPSYFQIMAKKRIHAGKPSRELFTPEIMPLVAEPGTKWTYGHSTDWLGLVVEEVSGMRLSEFLQANVFVKAGITSCTFQIDDESKVLPLHENDGTKLSLFLGKRPVPLKAEIDMGGQGCFGTVGDYLRFMRIWLNFGVSPDTESRILSRELVEYAIKNHLPADQLVLLPILGTDSNDGQTLIGCACNTKLRSTGRPAGSAYWTGLANLNFWMDFKNGIAALWACQMLPPRQDTCLKMFDEFETAVYETLGPKSRL